MTKLERIREGVSLRPGPATNWDLSRNFADMQLNEVLPNALAEEDLSGGRSRQAMQVFYASVRYINGEDRR
jgi:hypothetical protein